MSDATPLLSSVSWPTRNLAKDGTAGWVPAWRDLVVYGAKVEVCPISLDQITDRFTEPYAIGFLFRDEHVEVVVSRQSVESFFRAVFPFAEWADVPAGQEMEALLASFINLPRSNNRLPDLGLEVAPLYAKSAGTVNGSHAFSFRAAGIAFPVLLKVGARFSQSIDTAVTAWPGEIDRRNFKIDCRFCAGYGHITKAELRDAQVGDVVVVDGPGQAAGSMIVILSETFFSLVQVSDTRIKLSAFKRVVSNEFQRLLMQNDSSSKIDPIELDDLGDLKLTLVFEAGRKMLSLEELEQLSPGDILDMNGPARFVDILHGGQKIGSGELVTVNDVYGVRINRLAGS